MKVVLLISLMIAGEWSPGSDIEGWAPREQPSIEVCMERAETVMKNPLPDGVDKLLAFCMEYPDLDE